MGIVVERGIFVVIVVVILVGGSGGSGGCSLEGEVKEVRSRCFCASKRLNQEHESRLS